MVAERDTLQAFDTAVYARDMALNLAAMAESVQLVGLAALFRAAAAEAAQALTRLPAQSEAYDPPRAAGCETT